MRSGLVSLLPRRGAAPASLLGGTIFPEEPVTGTDFSVVTMRSVVRLYCRPPEMNHAR
jgi:hypothetical protein